MILLQLLAIIYILANVFIFIIVFSQMEKYIYKLKDVTYLHLILAIIFLPSFLIILFCVLLCLILEYIISLKIWNRLNVKILKDKE